MDGSALRLFHAVAETGSVSRAAERLHCVQSNVTARLKRLEEELDVKLFVRASRGMVLTPAGRVLDDYAQRLLSLVDEARRAVSSVRDGGGPLILGSMETTAGVRLPGVLSQFHKAYPGIEITLHTGNSEQLAEEVLARRLDAAMVSAAIIHPELVGQEVFVEELVLVHDGAPNSKGVLLSFRKGCSYRAVAETWLRENRPGLLRVMEFGTLDGILGCVAAGMGYAVLPRIVVERSQYAQALTIESLPHDVARVPTQLIRRIDGGLHPALDIFTKMLVAQM